MAPQSANPIEVFYSYSHRDEGLRDQLENHLTMLQREGVIKGWHDRRITAGQEWDGRIAEHLNSANIILLLVSSDFLASNYCYDIEVKRAMERHNAGEARVIPIILRPCDWQSAPFGKVQALPKDARAVTRWEDIDEAFLNVARGIRLAAKEISAENNVGTSSSIQEVRPAPHLDIPDILRVPFVERKDREGNNIIERLKEELAPNKNHLIALWGAGGVGKTAIAAEVARALTGVYDNRVIWVSADGREDFNLTALLDGIATQLGQVDLRKLALEPKKERLREVLMSLPTLVVLDNFETISPEEGKHCAEWLAQPALCSALITTRQNVGAAHRNIPTGPMSPDEADRLLERLLAEVRDQNAFATLDRQRVIQTSESNPLVLQWIIRQIDLAQDAEEVLDDLKQGEGKAAERVFDRSFKLKQLDNGGRAVLLALSLFVPSATRKALAEVAGFSLGKEKDKKRFREAVKTLSSLWLLRTVEAGERLVVEGLTRELTKARLSHDPRSKTIYPRYIARFLNYAEANSKPTVGDLNSIEIERGNVLNAIDVAFELSSWDSVMRLCGAISEFLRLRGYWDEALRRGEQALNVARDRAAEALISVFAHNVAIVHHYRGNSAEARRLYDESLEIKKRLGNQSGIAATLHQLGIISSDVDNFKEAAGFLNQSLIILEKLGDKKNIAECLESIGNLRAKQSSFSEARSLHHKALQIAQSLGDRFRIANVTRSLGLLDEKEGDRESATQSLRESMKIFEELGSPKAKAARQDLERVETETSS